MTDPTMEELRALYQSMKTIAVVGCSTEPTKAANYIPRYLRAYGYTIVPVNPRESELLGVRCYPSLAEVDVPVDVVQVFRPPAEAPAIAAAAVALGARCLWLQLGLRSDEAARVARAGGLMVVMDRCMGVVHGLLGLGPGVHLGDEWHRGLEPVAPRSREEQPYLQVTAGPAEGRHIPTTSELIIGRQVDGPGSIPEDEHLSRTHARVSRTSTDQVNIADLESSNGTYVNGVRVEEQVLAIGDTVQLGSSALELRTPEGRAPKSALHDRAQLNLAALTRVAARPSGRDAGAFRAEFPVFESVAYLNAGSDGPVPSRALDAAAAHVKLVLGGGRAGESYSRRLRSAHAALRSGYARVLGCELDEVALTSSTADGVNTVLSGLHLRRRDEILTSDEEHLSVLAPLAALGRRLGVDVRRVPFEAVADEVGLRTRLVVCSHVTWRTGRVAAVDAIVEAGAPVLLDGAQALGAIPVDVRALGCDYYAASGQKWLCGPPGTGCLYVRGSRLRTLAPPWPSAASVGDARDSAEPVYHAGARRFDTGVPDGALAAWALASLEVIEGAGLEWVLDRGPTLAASLADRLAERGVTIAPRGRSTLVSWAAADCEAEVARLADAGITVRAVADRGLVRASVGAWNAEDELDRVAEVGASPAS
jgi:selenocysteine lyase/cysteine desulfurase/predicted CoA-binding protein